MMDDSRKKLVNDYRQRKSNGGVYKITNRQNGRYLLGRTPDLRAMQNRFDFSVATNSCLHPKLRQDWQEYSSSVFTFEILETIEAKTDQRPDEFADDLKTLEEICRRKLDPSGEY